MKGKKFYIAERSDLGDAVVWVVKRGDKTPLPLEPSLKIRNHSPTGFEWGYGGSGPAQLALAILLDCTGCPEVALSYYLLFKAEEIAKAPLQGFQISAQEIVAWMDGVEPWRWAQSDLDRMREWGRK